MKVYDTETHNYNNRHEIMSMASFERSAEMVTVDQIHLPNMDDETPWDRKTDSSDAFPSEEEEAPIGSDTAEEEPASAKKKENTAQIKDDGNMPRRMSNSSFVVVKRNDSAFSSKDEKKE